MTLRKSSTLNFPTQSTLRAGGKCTHPGLQEDAVERNEEGWQITATAEDGAGEEQGQVRRETAIAPHQTPQRYLQYRPLRLH